jgi:hypothetical protein
LAIFERLEDDMWALVMKGGRTIDVIFCSRDESQVATADVLNVEMGEVWDIERPQLRAGTKDILCSSP